MQDTDEQPDDAYIEWDAEVSWAQVLLSLWSWGAPPFWHVDMFMHLEALQTLYFGIFMEIHVGNMGY